MGVIGPFYSRVPMEYIGPVYTRFKKIEMFVLH